MVCLATCTYSSTVATSAEQSAMFASWLAKSSSHGFLQRCAQAARTYGVRMGPLSTVLCCSASKLLPQVMTAHTIGTGLACGSAQHVIHTYVLMWLVLNWI